MGAARGRDLIQRHNTPHILGGACSWLQVHQALIDALGRHDSHWCGQCFLKVLIAFGCINRRLRA